MRSEENKPIKNGEVGVAGRSRNPYLAGVFAIILSLVSKVSWAGEDAGLRVLKLNSILGNFAVVRQSLLIQNEGRISVMEEAVKRLKRSIEEDNFGAATITHYQQMFFASFKVSQPLFEFIQTDRSRQAIRNIVATYLEIRRSTKYDEEPHSKDIFAHMTQLKDSLGRFLQYDKIHPTLRNKLNYVNRLLAEAAPVADVNGDGHVRTLKYTKLIHDTLYPLYKDLYVYRDTHPFSEQTSEIIGLNDNLGTYIDAAVPKDPPSSEPVPPDEGDA